MTKRKTWKAFAARNGDGVSDETREAQQIAAEWESALTVLCETPHLVADVRLGSTEVGSGTPENPGGEYVQQWSQRTSEP